jgi:hypothetical protein
MLDLSSYLPKAEQVATLIDDLMLDELHLAAPAAYELNLRCERVYLVGSYDALRMGRSLSVYEHPEIARRIRIATGYPTTITKETGTRYVVLLDGKVSLPRKVVFPGVGERDVFKLGVGVKGEVRIPVTRFQNGMIGAGPGSGKSTILELLIHQMSAWGWRLYLADPQSHTFNPDQWNRFAALPVAGSHADMLHVLNAIEEELATRADLFRRSAIDGHIPADIDEYNKTAPRLGASPIARIGFLCDESNFFLGHKQIFGRMADLLRQGRKWGLHIVLAAHEWHKDNVPAAVNDLLQTRIALNSLSGAVVLRSSQWGKWVEGRPAGRGVLRLSKYTPMQFYMLEEGTEIQQLDQAKKVSPISEREAELVRRSLAEADGKMTMGLLMSWGLSQDDARELGSRYEAKGWVAKDPDRGNARCVTGALMAILAESATNPQTPQTPQTAVIFPQTLPQTAHKPPQTDFDQVLEDLSRSEP